MAVCSMLAFFESLRLLPLATVIAISFAAPLFMTLLSVPLLKERVGVHRWGALLAGFLGVSLIVGPQAMDGELGLGAGLALVAAFFYAASMTCVRWLSPTESDLSMLVWQNLTMGLAGAMGLFFVPLEVTPGMWPIVALMAVGEAATDLTCPIAVSGRPVSGSAISARTDVTADWSGVVLIETRWGGAGRGALRL
jgi:drug/metabolite transporter (DMT)-like permease